MMSSLVLDLQADLSIMIGNRLTLLMDDDVEEIKVSAQQLRQLLPGVNVDAFVADYPAVLDVEDFKMALEVSICHSKFVSTRLHCCNTVGNSRQLNRLLAVTAAPY